MKVLASQSLSSLTNFLFLATAAALLPDDQFASLAVLYGLHGAAIGLTRVAVLEEKLIRGNRFSATGPASIGILAYLALLLATHWFIGSSFSTTSVFAAFTLASLLNEILRYDSFAQESWAAAAGDATWLLATPAIFIATDRLSWSTSQFLVGHVIAILVSSLVIAGLRTSATPGATNLRAESDDSASTAAPALDHLLGAAPAILTFALIVATADSSSAAGYRITLLLLQPASTLIYPLVVLRFAGRGNHILSAPRIAIALTVINGIVAVFLYSSFAGPGDPVARIATWIAFACLSEIARHLTLLHVATLRTEAAFTVRAATVPRILSGILLILLSPTLMGVLSIEGAFAGRLIAYLAGFACLQRLFHRPEVLTVTTKNRDVV